MRGERENWYDVVDPSIISGLQVIDITHAPCLSDRKAIKEAFRSFGRVRNLTDGRVVVFPSASVGKMWFNSGVDIRCVASEFATLFSRSYRAWSEPNAKIPVGDLRRRHEAIHQYVAKFRNSNGRYFIRFTVKENTGGGQVRSEVHSAVVSGISIYKTEGAELSTPVKTQAEDSAPFVDDKLALFFSCVNREMRIKVIGNVSRTKEQTAFEYAPGFVFDENPACDAYDWLVVYDELRTPERLACPPGHTILATSEPVSIKHYSRAYVRQFGHLLTNRPDVDGHPHYHLGRGYYKWFCDRTHPEATATVIPPKTKLISAVCSSKQMKHTKHFARFRLISELAKAIPELEWYGHGVRSFGKKHEVMDPYKYHVVIENHISPHHWTEKLSDAFLCECLPFYAGAPDLAEDFPAKSFIPIPIDDPSEAVRIVKEAIAAGEYEKRREAILEAKRLILTKYNFWAQVVGVINSAESGGEKDRPAVPHEFLVPRKVIRWHNAAAALGDAWWHFCRWL